jgi:hypothetical protein
MSTTFTTPELAKCAADEVYMRRQVYPRWVERGRMTKERAEREIAMMQAITDQLLRDAASERLL